MIRFLLLLLSLGLVPFALAGLPGSGEVCLEGEYDGHLQDVWYDPSGKVIYWAHTQDLLKTDLEGHIIKHVRVDGHHAGIELRDGRLFVAVCEMQSKTKGKTTPNSRVSIGEYDAVTLALIKMHVTDINDRSGSLAMLEDGSFVVGCLRPQDISLSQVRFHHIGSDYRLISSHVLDNVPVLLGIEVIKYHDGELWLCFNGCDKNRKPLGFDCLRLGGNFKEIWRGKLTGSCGLVFENGKKWLGWTHRVDPKDKKNSRWISGLRRKKD